MSKTEHMQLARQGVLAIAQWREEHPDEYLDFSGASLSNHNLNRADLREADLSRADLMGIHLNQARLYKANLSGAASLMGSFNAADLTQADLTGSLLKRANLTEANLEQADLSGADLSGADLSRANLNNANLSGADLSETKLCGANLAGADLNRVDLNYADLTEANFTGANLGKVTFFRSVFKDAVFNGSIMFHTVFGDCDLSVATGLAEVNHRGPSTLGTDTLSRSTGGIPERFLRGTGVPEGAVISYRDSEATGSAPYYTCHISYYSRDRAFAQRLHEDLRARGVTCWSFPADLRGGRWVPETTTSDELGIWITDDVDRGIRYYDKLVVVVSEESLANEHLREEMSRAARKQEETDSWLFIPVIISDAAYDERNRNVRLLQLSKYMLFDFRGWEEPQSYSAAVDTLHKALRTNEEASAGMEPAEEAESP